MPRMFAGCVVLLLLALTMVPVASAQTAMPTALLTVREDAARGLFVFDLTDSIPVSGVANLVQNGGFEGAVAPWKVAGSRPDASVAIAAPAYQGVGGLRLTVPAGAAGFVEISQNLTPRTSGGHEVRARVWQDGDARVTLAVEGGSTVNIQAREVLAVWQSLWSPLQATAGTPVRIVLRVEVANNEAVNVSLDDVLLREGLTYDWRLDGQPFGSPAPLFEHRFDRAGVFNVTGYAVQSGKTASATKSFQVNLATPPVAVLDVREGPVPGAFIFDQTSSVPPSGVRNRVENGNFENNLASWQVGGSRTDARVDIDGGAYAGKNALRIYVPPGPSGFVEISQTVENLSRGPFDLRVRVRDDGGADDVALWIDGVTPVRLNVTARGPFWQTLWAPVQGEGTARVILRLAVLEGRGATAWFDEVLLREGLTYDWRLDGERFGTPAPVFGHRFIEPGVHNLTAYVAAGGVPAIAHASFVVTAASLAKPNATLDIDGPGIVFAGVPGTWTAGNSRNLNPNLLVNPDFEFGLNGWALDVSEGPGFLHAQAEAGTATVRFRDAGSIQSISFSQVVEIKHGDTYDFTVRHRAEGDVLGFAYILREVGFPEGRYVATEFRDAAWSEPASETWAATQMRWRPQYPESTHVYVLLRALVKGDGGLIAFDNASLAKSANFSWAGGGLNSTGFLWKTALKFGTQEVNLRAGGHGGVVATHPVIVVNPSTGAKFSAALNGTVDASGVLPPTAAGSTIVVRWSGPMKGHTETQVDDNGQWATSTGARWSSTALRMWATIPDAEREFELGAREFDGEASDFVHAVRLPQSVSRLQDHKFVIELEDSRVENVTLGLRLGNFLSHEILFDREGAAFVANYRPGFLTRPGEYTATLIVEGAGERHAYPLGTVTVRLSGSSEGAAPWVTGLFAAVAVAASAHAFNARRESR